MTEPGTDIEAVGLPAPAEDETGLERLQRRPIIDRIEPRTLDLIKKTLAVGEGGQVITNAEIGHFLELCANYGLDPFAREAWIAKSKSGKLLIMVGRDGLRKIVNDNGLVMRGAAIYASDEFSAEWIESPEDAKEGEWAAHGSAPFTRVTHKRAGFGADGRGAVVGAWARVYDAKSRVERSYFDAPISEYMPSNVSVYSPWSKQVSAMMLGAVERQAARQATPLGGLMADGEQYTVESAGLGAGEGDGSEPGWEATGLTADQILLVEGVIAKADAVGYGVLGSEARGPIQMKLHSQPPSYVEKWVAWADAEVLMAEDAAKAAATESTAVEEPPEGDQQSLDGES